MDGEATRNRDTSAARTRSARKKTEHARAVGPGQRAGRVLCALTILLGSARSGAADCAVPPYAATYSVRARDIEVAQIRQTLEATPGSAYRFRSCLDVHLLFRFRAADEVSVGGLAGGRLARTGGFRFTERRPLGSHEEMAAPGEYDPLSYQLALREDLLFHSSSLSYRVRDGFRTDVYDFAATPEPMPLVTALGQLAVVRADRQEPRDERLSLWFAPQLGYLLVQTRLESSRYGVVGGVIATYEPQNGNGCVIEGPTGR